MYDLFPGLGRQLQNENKFVYVSVDIIVHIVSHCEFDSLLQSFINIILPVIVGLDPVPGVLYHSNHSSNMCLID